MKIESSHPLPRYNKNHSKFTGIIVMVILSLLLPNLVLGKVFRTLSDLPIDTLETSDLETTGEYSLPDFTRTVTNRNVIDYQHDDIRRSVDIFTDDLTEEHIETVMSFVPELAPALRSLFNDFSVRIDFLLRKKSSQTLNQSNVLGTKFARLYFSLHKVNVTTLWHITRIESLIVNASLSPFKTKMASILLINFVLKKYYQCRKIVRDEAHTLVSNFVSKVEGDKWVWNKFIKAFLLEDKVHRKLFKYLDKDNVGELKTDTSDQRAFKAMATQIANRGGKVWYMKRVTFAPYYVTMESLYDVIYLFDLDKDGGVTESRTWMRDFGETFIEDSDSFMAFAFILRLYEEMGMVLTLDWVTNKEVFDIKKLHLSYLELIGLTNGLGRMLNKYNAFTE